MSQLLQFPDHIMTMAELKEYKALAVEIFEGCPLVVTDPGNPKHARYNELAIKYGKLRAYTLKVLNSPLNRCPEKEVCTYSRSCSGNCI